MSGRLANAAGRAAEDAVARHYAARGAMARDRRWRGGGGEIDLILTDAAGDIVFVEVKHARTHAAAAHALGAAQMARLARAADTYLGTLPAGRDTPCRFDAALVDRGGAIEVIENAFV